MIGDLKLANEVQAGLARAMARAGGGDVLGLTRLSGGANMESWSFDCAGMGYVLRRSPSPEMTTARPMDLATEARVIRTARSIGVRAPEIVTELEPDDGLGEGFVMRRIAGEVSPTAILANPPTSLLADLAMQLAAIHRAPLSAIEGLPTLDAAHTLADLRARFLQYGGDRPVLALALRWLQDNLPEPSPPVLVHGDFRIGNLIVSADGVAGVLDWEMAHAGDAHDDLAYGCLTVWRYGAIDKPAFGLGGLDEFFAAYEAAGGTRPDPVRFRFWLVFRTLWWALGCLQMGDLWRRHADRNLERVVIARRAGENEVDLLLLLEEEAPHLERERRLPPPPASAPQPEGEPSAEEMLTAVAEWLEGDVKPRGQGRDKFLTAVALNALGMVRRELRQPAAFADRALCDEILQGRATLARPGLLAQLRRSAVDKLANDVPKYPALAKARALWRA